MLSHLSRFAADSFNYTTTSSNHISGGLFAVLAVVITILAIIEVVSMWKVFVKAGRPGWAAIVPFYNAWVLFEISGKPGWWVLPLIAVSFIPVVGSIIALVVVIIVYLELAKRFGKGPLFAIFGLTIFNFIGFPILAYGDAQYHDPNDPAAGAGDPAPASPGLWSQAGTGPAAPTNDPSVVVSPTPPAEPQTPFVAPPQPEAPVAPAPPTQPETNPLPPEQPQDPQNPTPPAAPAQ